MSRILVVMVVAFVFVSTTASVVAKPTSSSTGRNAQATPNIAPSPTGTPQPLSSGCRFVNANSRLDTRYYSMMLPVRVYHAGEHIIISAVPLVREEPAPLIWLVVTSPRDGMAVFTGSGEYIFAADGSYQLGWRGDQGDAIWTVSCGPASQTSRPDASLSGHHGGARGLASINP